MVKPRPCPKCKALLIESRKSQRFAKIVARILVWTVIPFAALLGNFIGVRLMNSKLGILIGPAIAFCVLMAGAFLLDPYTTEYELFECRVCVTCGYDLTGNMSGVCPECGTRVKFT